MPIRLTMFETSVRLSFRSATFLILSSPRPKPKSSNIWNCSIKAPIVVTKATPSESNSLKPNLSFVASSSTSLSARATSKKTSSVSLAWPFVSKKLTPNSLRAGRASPVPILASAILLVNLCNAMSVVRISTPVISEANLSFCKKSAPTPIFLDTLSMESI